MIQDPNYGTEKGKRRMGSWKQKDKQEADRKKNQFSSA